MMVTINIDLKDVYSTMSEESILAGRRALSNQALADMNENFVPMRDGWLRNSAILALDGSEIIWNTPYASAQYYGGTGDVEFSRYTTPGTGPHWDLKAKAMFMSDWVDAYTKGAGL